MAALVETIAVVDKSGKAISSSKHLVNIFKEAKAAYQDRKAEIAAARQRSQHDRGRSHRNVNARAETIRSSSSSPTYRSRPHQDHRRQSSGSIRSGSTVSSDTYTQSRHRHAHDDRSSISSAPKIRRSHTADEDSRAIVQRKPVPTRSMTEPMPASDIDMSLAYGDLPPTSPTTRGAGHDQAELNPLVVKVKQLLEEADCLQHTASATMASLQKNPEAMAAVALALAEISNLVRKMSPGALIALRNSAPAVFALLASPQFMIAGGVAVGLTVVAFGGYKIIKRIKAREAVEQENGMDEMLEIGGDVSRIETWRRGIAESEIQSEGTSVDGEFITPHAHALSRLNLQASDNERRSRGHRSHSKVSSSQASSKRSEGGSSTGSTKRSEKSKSKSKEKAVKKPSPLRLMFH